MARPLAAFVLMAVTAAGCVAEAPGQPVPNPSDASTSQSTSETRAGEAPPINSPEIDLANYESRICDLLTPAQLAPFAIRTPGRPGDAVVGPFCTWDPPDTSAGSRISIAILSKVGYGWEGVYERKDKWTLFEDGGEINGYPVVHLEATTDGTRGLCTTTVGARQDVVFETSVFVNRRESPEYKNACSVSDRVAGLVIDTLRGGR